LILYCFDDADSSQVQVRYLNENCYISPIGEMMRLPGSLNAM